jgi:transcriptional regulator with XRE-family HTH domain
MPDAMAEDYRARIARLRAARGMSLEDLAFEARSHAPKGTVSLSLIQKRLAPGSTAQPTPQMLEALAGALGVDPSEFGEYRLAKARQLLDEREHGLDDALATLTQLTDALRIAAVRSATEAERRAHSDLLRRSNPGEAQTPPEAEQRGS